MAMTSTEPGLARSPGISYQELLDTDTHPVPSVLRLESTRDGGSADISKDRYTSRAWHELEVEHLWKRVWQFACREEEIPRPGDYQLYEIAGLSFIVIRTNDGSIKAYPNACLHRGRQLKDYSGHCSEIRCSFHAFTWTIDGALAHVPARWDFPHIDTEAFHLPELQVGTWAGFVFINPDPNAEPLMDFIGGLDDHFAIWKLENSFIEPRADRVEPANMESDGVFRRACHCAGLHPLGPPPDRQGRRLSPRASRQRRRDRP